MNRFTLTSGLPLVVVFAAFSGCDESPTELEEWPEPPPDVTPYVTGAALEGLDEHGHFKLTGPPAETTYPIIGSAQAREIAMGVIRTWYANPDVITLGNLESLAESAEMQHGGPIDWSVLRPAAREPYFAESHLEPLPPEAGLPTIRHYGPRFLVPLDEGSEPVVTVSVSAYATNTSIDDQGFVRRAGDPTGGEFRVSGISTWLAGASLPPSPETAVEFAATRTGAKVVEVPRLGRPGNFVSSVASRWRLLLDRDVAFERVVDGQTVITREIYVGAWPSITDARLGLENPGAALRLLVAADEQPEIQELPPVKGVIRSGYAVDLHEVEVR